MKTLIMKNRSFPSWAGPIVGTVVGAGVAAKVALEEDSGLPVQWTILGGAVAGLLAGGIVWLLDAMKKND